MDHQNAARAATVGFWQGLVWALVGTVGAALTVGLAAAFHQLITVLAVIAAGLCLYRDRKRSRELVASA
jgi:hypothetical protein